MQYSAGNKKRIRSPVNLLQMVKGTLSGRRMKTSYTAQNKQFWNSVKTYLTFKGILRNDNVALSFENQTLTYNTALAKLFNEYHIYIIKNITGTAPVKVISSYGFDGDRLVVDKIIKT